MKVQNKILLLCLLSSMFVTSGCHYGMNRSADFRDIFQMGIGLTTENPESGIIPPSLGFYVQATEFLNLGIITFAGKSAEWDGRGLYYGPERRFRLGLLNFQELLIDQDYENGSENYFKKVNTLWADRMNSPSMRWRQTPAKSLDYDFWSISRRQGKPIMHRGWQYWENFNVELGISEPFITHFGLNLRFGFDPSEIFDFILGFAKVDFKRDDTTLDEYDEYLEMKGESRSGSSQARPPSSGQ